MSGPLTSLHSEFLSHSRVGQSMPTMRRYHAASLTPTGEIRDDEIRAPATPEFQAAFNAFAHGSIISTTEGEVAIEDLRPGMKVQTREHGPQTVMWIGNMTHIPDPNGAAIMTRVTSDRFGAAQPALDLLAGPGARMLHRPAGARFDQNDRFAYTPLRDFIDGDGVIGIPLRMASDTYHICLRRHATIRVGGLDLETFHPGMTILEQMGNNTRDLFLSMFPHIPRATDFGKLAHPRLTLQALEDAAA